MKSRSSKFASIIILFVFFISCNSNKENEYEIDSIKIRDTNYQLSISDTTIVVTDSISTNSKIEKIASKYICPLGDKEGMKDKAGICPVCEMELIENPDYNIKTLNK